MDHTEIRAVNVRCKIADWKRSDIRTKRGEREEQKAVFLLQQGFKKSRIKQGDKLSNFKKLRQPRKCNSAPKPASIGAVVGEGEGEHEDYDLDKSGCSPVFLTGSEELANSSPSSSLPTAPPPP